MKTQIRTVILPLNDRMTEYLSIDSESYHPYVENDVALIDFDLGVSDDFVDRIFCTLPEFQVPEEKHIYLGTVETSKGRFDVFEIIEV